jgi:hypothetical protein
MASHLTELSVYVISCILLLLIPIQSRAKSHCRIALVYNSYAAQPELPDMTKGKITAILVTVLVLTMLPYLIAARMGGPGYVFSGFLLNPLDGFSYLAKMYQGWSGSWTFRLPFSADPGQGSYLFLFYLFLGHVARWVHLPLIWTFHLARTLSITALVFALAYFFQRLLPDGRQAWLAFTLAALGSGLGWLAVFLGGFTSDFWVAEAYPFLSAYANPHFPLAIALLLWLLTVPVLPINWFKALAIIMASLLLGVILPFGVVVACAILAGVTIWEWIDQHRLSWYKLALVIAGGAAPLVYDLVIVRLSPQLAAWNSQNLTPAPPLWDLLVSLSPLLFLAIPGAYFAVKRRDFGSRLMIIWAVLGLALVYAPFNLQRRFMLALYIPLAGLSTVAIFTWAGNTARRYRITVAALFLLVVPTNLVIIASGIGAAMSHEEHVYLSRGEDAALSWLRANTPQDALVLASPESGALIPAYTGRRVLYGHPFETMDAAEVKARVIAFFDGKLDSQEKTRFLLSEGVNYLFWGPREDAFGAPPGLDTLKLVYQSQGVTIYAISTSSP